MKKASECFFVQIGSMAWDLNKNYKIDDEGLSRVKIFGFLAIFSVGDGEY